MRQRATQTHVIAPQIRAWTPCVCATAPDPSPPLAQRASLQQRGDAHAPARKRGACLLGQPAQVSPLGRAGSAGLLGEPA
eukprot:278381-Chlamydomonas_euryale.AAC.20